MGGQKPMLLDEWLTYRRQQDASYKSLDWSLLNTVNQAYGYRLYLSEVFASQIYKAGTWLIEQSGEFATPASPRPRPRGYAYDRIFRVGSTFVVLTFTYDQSDRAFLSQDAKRSDLADPVQRLLDDHGRTWYVIDVYYDDHAKDVPCTDEFFYHAGRKQSDGTDSARSTISSVRSMLVNLKSQLTSAIKALTWR